MCEQENLRQQASSNTAQTLLLWLETGKVSEWCTHFLFIVIVMKHTDLGHPYRRIKSMIYSHSRDLITCKQMVYCKSLCGQNVPQHIAGFYRDTTV